MDNRITQYATIFDAAGFTLLYNSSGATINVGDSPTGIAKKIVEQALRDISNFDDTTNSIDRVAALCVADFIDEIPNPIPETSRRNILEALGLMKDGLYVYQVLALQKNNRSWHFSGIANDCEHFGEICTHRGISPKEHKGRRSERQPEDYHPVSANGKIAREQLVTPALEEVFRQIPDEAVIRAKTQIEIPVELIRAFKKLPLDKQLEFISDLERAS